MFYFALCVFAGLFFAGTGAVAEARGNSENPHATLASFTFGCVLLAIAACIIADKVGL